MMLGEVINAHYTTFHDVVDPAALASRLKGLTQFDRRRIIQKSSNGDHLVAVFELTRAINGKVKWHDLQNALKEMGLISLAAILENEYYKQNPKLRRPQNETPDHSRGEPEYLPQKQEPCPSTSATAQCSSAVQKEQPRVVIIAVDSTINLQIGNNNSLFHYNCEQPADDQEIPPSEEFEVVEQQTKDSLRPGNRCPENGGGELGISTGGPENTQSCTAPKRNEGDSLKSDTKNRTEMKMFGEDPKTTKCHSVSGSDTGNEEFWNCCDTKGFQYENGSCTLGAVTPQTSTSTTSAESSYCDVSVQGSANTATSRRSDVIDQVSSLNIDVRQGTEQKEEEDETTELKTLF